MHPDIRRAGEHKKTPVRINALKCFSGSPCHVKTEQVVYLVVTDHLSVYIMIESPVIILAVCEAPQLVAELPYADIFFRFRCFFASVPVTRSGLGKLTCHLTGFFKTFRRVEDCRFVHVVPEALNALIREKTVFVTEPFPCLGIQHIRKMGISRPHCSHEVAAVFSLAKVAVFNPFFVDVVSVLNLYTCVNDRDQADMAVFHFPDKCREIFEIIIYGKVLVRIHVINIHIDHIQRNVILTVALCDFFKIFLCLVAPAALAESECEFRRDIAVSDHAAELFYDIIRSISVNDVQCEVRVLAGNLQCVHAGVSDIKCQF